MMRMFLMSNGDARVRIICDHCGKPIEKAHEGNWVWDEKDESGEKGAELLFTHKTCDHAFQMQHTELTVSWELNLLPVRLARALKMEREDMEKARKQDMEWCTMFHETSVSEIEEDEA